MNENENDLPFRGFDADGWLPYHWIIWNLPERGEECTEWPDCCFVFQSSSFYGSSSQLSVWCPYISRLLISVTLRAELAAPGISGFLIMVLKTWCFSSVRFLRSGSLSIGAVRAELQMLIFISIWSEVLIQSVHFKFGLILIWFNLILLTFFEWTKISESVAVSQIWGDVLLICSPS